MFKKTLKKSSLLRQKHFLPFFMTQFFGAFNDNIFKNALIILIAFKSELLGLSNPDMLINLTAALFILPFFIFSTTAGQWIDKFEKSKSIRQLKLIELLIMLVAALAFYQLNIFLLMVLIFFMGLQSTFFGPAKYSYIPQHLKLSELTEANAYVQMGTFVAILLGTIVAGVLIALPGGLHYIAVIIILIAFFGYLSSLYIPLTPSKNPALKINWNLFKATYQNIQFIKSNKTVFLSIIAISWFWFFGASYLVQLPTYCQKVLLANEEVVTLLLVIFTVGIGSGTLLCNKLSGHKIEIGLVPFAAIGLTIFSLDFALYQPKNIAGELMDVVQFLSLQNYRLLFDLFLIGFFGGLYIVPLMALVQQCAEQSSLSQIIAGNNIINGLTMVLSALFAMLLFSYGFDHGDLFISLALLNTVVAIYIFSVVPEFFIRFIDWLLVHSIYHVRSRGLEKIPEQGAALLVSNHVSFVDALIIASCIRRPIRFVMYYKIYNIPILNFIFKKIKSIPIAGKSEDEKLLNQAFEDIEHALNEGCLVCIFPEGKITKDGQLSVFKTGVESIVKRVPVVVIPLALQGLWGSVFSRKGDVLVTRLFRSLKTSIKVIVGDVVLAENVNAKDLQKNVALLLEQKF